MLFLIIVGVFYGDEVKQIIVTEISKKLNIEVSVKKINLSLFNNFPDASVELLDIQTNERNTQHLAPLLKAGKLSLLFDVFDILWGDYTIEKIVLKDAVLNLLVINDSVDNFNIFHQGANGKSTSVNLNLKKVYLSNVQVNYSLYPSDQEYNFIVKNGILKGAFSKKNYGLEMEGDLLTNHIRSGSTYFLKDRDLNLLLIMNVDKDKKLYTLNETQITVSGIKVNAAGTIQFSNLSNYLNLSLHLEKAKLPAFLDLIPDEYKQSLKNYSFDGVFNLNAIIEGEFAGNVLPQIFCDFNINEGKLKYIPSGLTFRNVSLKGEFDNGRSRTTETYTLKLFGFNAGINAGVIQGELTLINFLKPTITVSLTSSLNLDKLDEIIQIEALQSISGKLDLNLKFSNSLKNLQKFSITDFISSKTSGSMKISNVSLKLKNDPVSYHNLNGTFRFNNKDLLVDDFRGNINESDFSMKGHFLNILAYAFTPEEDIKIRADFSSSKLNMDDLLSFRKDNKGSRYRMKFSDRLNFNLDLDIKNFTFGTFNAQNIRGNAVMKNNRLQISDATLHSMEGKTMLSGSIDGNYPDKFWVTFTADIQDVNISKLFFELGNFGQQNITSEQIRGKMDATIYYKSFIDPELNIDPKSVYALGDISIRQGELIKYSPLYKLSKYIKKRELEHIRFSTLKNQIEIKEEVVYIPEMDIESSTLNLRIFGSHTFKNSIDYHVRVLLSEILSKRDKKKEEEIEGIFPEDDGLGQTTLYLHMTGNAEDPNIKYDTKEVRKKISADMNKEKQEIKEVFKREFSRKDQNRQSVQDEFNMTRPDSGKDFKIEWEEDPPENIKRTELPAKPKNQPEKKSGKKEFIIEWEQDNDTLR